MLKAEVSDVAWVLVGEMQTERSNLSFVQEDRGGGVNSAWFGEKAAGQKWLILPLRSISVFVPLNVCSNSPYDQFFLMFSKTDHVATIFWPQEGFVSTDRGIPKEMLSKNF